MPARGLGTNYPGGSSLKRLLTHLFKAAQGESPDIATGIADSGYPQPGQAYSFRTAPFSEFASSPTGRYGAFKIIGVTKKLVVVAVLDAIWSMPPTPEELSCCGILKEHRFPYLGGRPAVYGVNIDWWEPSDQLDELHCVATLSVSRSEQSQAAVVLNGESGARYAGMRSVDASAEGEWRWNNDQASFLAEVERKRVKFEAEQKAKEERYRTQLKKLTWEQLLSETPFVRWSPSPPYPSADFTKGAQATIREACLSLQALGPKPRKAEVRAILKQTVEWFNEADASAGGVIETEEREDIFAVLEEMAYVARQKSLADQIDQWRDW
jgi:hypothetical protein